MARAANSGVSLFSTACCASCQEWLAILQANQSSFHSLGPSMAKAPVSKRSKHKSEPMNTAKQHTSIQQLQQQGDSATAPEQAEAAAACRVRKVGHLLDADGSVMLMAEFSCPVSAVLGCMRDSRRPRCPASRPCRMAKAACTLRPTSAI